MKKFDRMEAFVAGLGPALPAALDPCYAGYFACFNRGEYYEAHDVLEHLWLQDRAAPDADFYKGLIQFAGGFVHLRKHRLRPEHPKDGRRLRPAARLFALARANLVRFAPAHRGLDVTAVLVVLDETVAALERSGFAANPWLPAAPPQLALPSA